MNREKIIEKLEKKVKRTYAIKSSVCERGENGYKKISEEITEHREPFVTLTIEMADKILALLKEQEAKVLTVDQLEDVLDTVVWLETPVSENLADGYSLITAYNHKYGYMYFDSPFGDNPSQDRLEYSEYDKSWRCWDKRPTDEQRQAVKWDE